MNRLLVIARRSLLLTSKYTHVIPLVLCRTSAKTTKRGIEWSWNELEERVWGRTTKTYPKENRTYIPPPEEDEAPDLNMGIDPVQIAPDIQYAPLSDVLKDIPDPRVRKVDELGRAYGTGRRKTSSARVWVKENGAGEFTVNGKPMHQYFPVFFGREKVVKPLVLTELLGKVDVHATVKGGGFMAQAGAVQLGIARAIQNLDPNYRPVLKLAGALRRDPRKVERKKYGQKKARKKFQWVKR